MKQSKELKERKTTIKASKELVEELKVLKGNWETEFKGNISIECIIWQILKVYHRIER